MFASSVKCTQAISCWNPDTDFIQAGDWSHYSLINSWDFQPILKAYSDDFKLCVHRPSGWISAEEATKAIDEHEIKLGQGIKGGQL